MHIKNVKLLIAANMIHVRMRIQQGDRQNGQRLCDIFRIVDLPARINEQCAILSCTFSTTPSDQFIFIIYITTAGLGSSTDSFPDIMNQGSDDGSILYI